MKSLSHSFRPFVAAALLALLAACATQPAPRVPGRWKPVNRYGDTPEAIPLRPSHIYFVAPVDRTLKGLLERWARDSHMTLDYQHEADFTLYRPVADVHGDDLHGVLSSVAALYAAQGVAIELQGDRIFVLRTGTASAATGDAP